MAVFGELWDAHEEKLAHHWRSLISDDDLIIIAGDISWAMRETEAQPDLDYIRSLPGEKILLKGNHDYWWSTRKKVKEQAGQGFRVLQNNALLFPGVTLVGTRGWEIPASPRFDANQDAAIYRREVERLKMSLQEGKKTGQPLIAVMHYPPLLQNAKQTDFSTLLEEYGVSICVYGHLHGQAHQSRVEGLVRNVRYQLVSSDFLNFVPLQIHETD